MKRILTLYVACMVAGCYAFAQVKGPYQYNTAMPYGTLDIRTRISSTNYYYLQENKTFSFRESSPGVRTDTYVDMTSWESSPYTQGNLRQVIGTVDKFTMNYRLLKPNGYTSTYSPGYPLIVHFHGAYERANCVYNQCYHSNWDYTVEANSPPAPTSPTHILLNNDDNLNVGGLQYLNARNAAGIRKPNDPTMPANAFPGFVLIPQMFNAWDSLRVEDVVRMVRLVAAKYKIDQDRIYVQGLSIGGYAVYEAMKRASWLFAAALPMVAVWDANIFAQNQQAKVAHMPIWIFQGGQDPRPGPAYTQAIVDNLTEAGAVVRYSLYPTLAHVVWPKAYSEPDYFLWMLKQTKANLHAFAGNLVIDEAKNIYPKLMLAEGFLAYQWEKDGVIQSNNTHTLTATLPGTYRARFSRKSGVPTEAQWNRWSDPVVVTETTGTGTTLTVSAGADQTLTLPANSIYLQGTASGSEPVASYQWGKISGPAASLSGTTTSTLRAYNLVAGTYVFRLTVTGTQGTTKSDDVQVIVNPSNTSTELTVSAGADQTLTLPTNSIYLQGTASGSEPIASYQWGKISGPPASLSGYTTSTLRAYNLVAGTYVFRLTVTGTQGTIKSDDVQVTVNSSTSGSDLAVSAGADQTLTLPTNSIDLQGTTSGSEPIASYQWGKISGPAASLSGTTTSTLRAYDLVAGTYVFRLTVTGTQGTTKSDDVQVIVNPSNTSTDLTVSAGADQTLTLPTNSIYLQGTASGSEPIASYQWGKISGPPASLSGYTTPTLRAYNLQAGTYLFRLTVKDTQGTTKSDDVQVFVNSSTTTSTDITVSAGADQTLTLPTNSIYLQGTASGSEPIASYQWGKISGPSASLSGYTTSTLRAYNLKAGTYLFRLTVKGTQGTTKSDDVQVFVNSTTTTASSARTGTQMIQVASEKLNMEKGLSFSVYPNPATADNIRLELQGMAEAPVQVKIVDQMGRELYAQTFENPGLASGQRLTLPSSSQGGVYILMVNQGERQLRRKVVVK